MNQKANYFKLGLFVISAFIFFALFLVIFGAGEFLKKELLVETCFNESVQGLSIGSEVKYKGIKIGTVKEIKSAAQVYETKSDYVLVILSLDEEIFLGQTGKTAKIRMQKAIQDGLIVQLSFKGLTGAAYLETDYIQAKPKEQLKITWEPRHIYIPSRQSSIKQFGNAVSEILDNLSAINLKGITIDIEKLLKILNTKMADFDMAAISTSLTSLIQEVKVTNSKISEVLDSARIQTILDDARVGVANFRSVMETSKDPFNQAIADFRQAAGSTKKVTRDLESQLTPRMADLARNLDLLIKHLSEASGQMENIMWLNSGKINRIVENLETTSENLKQLSQDLKRYPGRLLFEDPPPEQRPSKGGNDAQ